MPTREEAAKPQHPRQHRHHSVTHSGPGTRRPPGSGARGAGQGSRTRERGPGAPAAAQGGRAGRPLRRPASAHPRRRPSPPLAPPRAARGKFLQLRGGGGGRPGPRGRPAPRDQAPGRRRPNSRPARPAPGPALCAAARGARRPGPRPGHKRARGRRAARPGLRGARAGPSWGSGPRPGAGLRSPAVEPVLAGVALDHEAGNVVGQPADAVHRHRRHVRAARPPAARAALRVGPGGPGRAGAGRAGAGAGDGPGAHDSPRAPAARPHKAGRAQAAGSRPPARGRRARVCAGPARGTQKGMDARGRRAGGEPRPHRRDPRPPSGLYVSAPGGAASARGLAAAPAAGRRAGDRGEGGPATCWGEGGSGTPPGGRRRWVRDPSRAEGGLGDPPEEKVGRDTRGGRWGAGRRGTRETPCGR